jgi:hypothetical protein
MAVAIPGKPTSAAQPPAQSIYESTPLGSDRNELGVLCAGRSALRSAAGVI